jgi:hypothetical protein
LGARAAALGRADEHLRRQAAALAPDFTQLGATGLDSTRLWVWNDAPMVTGLATALEQGRGTAEQAGDSGAARFYCGERLRANRGRKKGKKECAEVSYPRVKLRWWSGRLEKRRSAGFTVARRLRFCRAAKREERLRERFPGHRALVEGCAKALRRVQVGQGVRNTPASWNHGGCGAHLRWVRVEFPSERASELRARAWWASERRGGAKAGTCRGGAAAERPVLGGAGLRCGGARWMRR